MHARVPWVSKRTSQDLASHDAKEDVLLNDRTRGDVHHIFVAHLLGLGNREHHKGNDARAKHQLCKNYARIPCLLTWVSFGEPGEKAIEVANVVEEREQLQECRLILEVDEDGTDPLEAFRFGALED